MRRTLLLLGLGVACWVAPGAAAPAARGGQTTADEPQYLLSALSLWEDRSLDVADERAEGRFRDFHSAALPQQEAVRPDGSRVSPHDPLLALLLAAPVGLGGWVAAKLAMAVLAGLLAAVTAWVAVRRFDVPIAVAVVTVAAFSAAAPLAVYGTQVYPELPAALAVVVAIGAITGPLGRRGAVAAGLAVVALPWLSVKYVPIAAALTFLALVRLARRGEQRRAVAFGGVLCCAAVFFAIAHVAWYGGLTPYASGSHFVAGELTVVGHDPHYLGRAVRLLGLLVDRDFGLVAWQPLFVLAVPSFAALVRRRPSGWDTLALPLVVGWLNATFVALTMHGWWFPGRQVVVVLPCLVLAVASWAARVPLARVLLALGGALGASVFAWLVVQGVFGDLTLVVTFDALTHPLARAWRLLLPDLRRDRLIDHALIGAWLVGLSVWAVRAWQGAEVFDAVLPVPESRSVL